MRRSKSIANLINKKPSLARIAYDEANSEGDERDRQWVANAQSYIDGKPLNLPKLFTVSDIKDIDEFELIYLEYSLKHYYTVINKIRAYGEFLFFRDTLIYLKARYSCEWLKNTTYEHLKWVYYDMVTI